MRHFSGWLDGPGEASEKLECLLGSCSRSCIEVLKHYHGTILNDKTEEVDEIKDLICRMENFEKIRQEKFLKVQEPGEIFNALLHFDLWICNFLFHQRFVIFFQL